MADLKHTLNVYIPDTRGVKISRYGKGNLKIGMDVYTYSRLPGLPGRYALGTVLESQPVIGNALAGTCPGASSECQEICYARRPVRELGPVMQMWLGNSLADDVPPIPDDAKLLRLHVSGDFNTVAYIENWIAELTRRPDVICWGYTRSWRIAELLPALERLRALPNVQLFASMDQSITEAPPFGWRRAWIDGDARAGEPIDVPAHDEVLSHHGARRLSITDDATPSYVCPEETGHRVNCQECGYCINGKRNDVTFLRH